LNVFVIHKSSIAIGSEVTEIDSGLPVISELGEHLDWSRTNC
jgi:hypothetical protein